MHDEYDDNRLHAINGFLTLDFIEGTVQFLTSLYFIFYSCYSYKSTAKKWPPELRIGVKEFPVLDP